MYVYKYINCIKINYKDKLKNKCIYWYIFFDMFVS